VRRDVETPTLLDVASEFAEHHEIKRRVEDMHLERVKVASQVIGLESFAVSLESAIARGSLNQPISARTNLVLWALDVVLERAVGYRDLVAETHNKACEHWVFLVGDFGRRLSGRGCRCEIVGTDRPFEREMKLRGA
jgi:hypothetical protein